MAFHMHINKTDEVARNGAFGKILRPEVFPDAPLQKDSICRPKPLRSISDGPPPKVILKYRGIERSAPHSTPYFRQQRLGNQWLVHIDPSLPQQPYHSIAL
jgi:hypothetical protein